MTADQPPTEQAEKPVVASVSLHGEQGEPAGMMTVTLHMSDGTDVPIIRDNGNSISHWARVDAARQQAAQSPAALDEAVGLLRRLDESIRSDIRSKSCRVSMETAATTDEVRAFLANLEPSQ